MFGWVHIVMFVYEMVSGAGVGRIEDDMLFAISRYVTE